MIDGRGTRATDPPPAAAAGPAGAGPPVTDRIGAHRARSVRVFAPAEQGRRPVLRWAARHAGRTGGCIQVLVDPMAPDEAEPEHPSGTVGLLTRAARDLVSRVVDPLRRPAPGSVIRELVGAVAGARLLVVPQSLPELPDVVDVLTEPVVAVPDRPLPSGDADIVLALAPWTGPEVVTAAFETAARYGVHLHVVQARGAAGELAAAVRACEDDLAAWRIIRPEVGVDVEIVDRDPAEALHRCARGAQLVVMGRPARGRARELLDPSPASELLRTAACPVLVVPPPGAPRPSWSPRPGWGTVH